MISFVRCIGLSLVVGALGCGPQVVLDEMGSSGDVADASSGGTAGGTGGSVPPSPGSTAAPGTPGTTAPPSDSFTTGPEPWGTTGPEPWGTTEEPVPQTTGMPTTAGDDGGVPGGAGPGAVPDPGDDVELPSADVVAAAVYTDGTMVDFRVQFADVPFTGEATSTITWCIEAGQGGNDACRGQAFDIDAHLVLAQAGAAGAFESATPPVDACLHGAFEPETNTLRILVPAATFPGTADFRWILTVTFGGSGGDNEWVPEEGKLDVTWVDELPPFSGDPPC